MTRKILVTGATGKVGQAFIRRILARSRVKHDHPYFLSSSWLDDSKAKFLSAGARPTIFRALTDAAFDYQRPENEKRIVRYSG